MADGNIPLVDVVVHAIVLGSYQAWTYISFVQFGLPDFFRIKQWLFSFVMGLGCMIPQITNMHCTLGTGCDQQRIS
jgi:hypothetical protein